MLNVFIGISPLIISCLVGITSGFCTWKLRKGEDEMNCEDKRCKDEGMSILHHILHMYTYFAWTVVYSGICMDNKISAHMYYNKEGLFLMKLQHCFRVIS